MNKSLALLMTTLLLGACVITVGPQTDRFERITPEQAGYSAEKLKALETFLTSKGSDSLLLLHNGKVFFEWGDIHKKILVYSMRKALLSSLIGIHHGLGEIELQQTLAELGIDDIVPTLTTQEKSAKVIDLLKSRSGVYHAAAAESEGMTARRPPRGSHAPGAHYHYNNWDFNVAGFVFEQRSGQRIYDSFEREIARPLGMLDYRNRIMPSPGETGSIDKDVDGYYKLEPQLSRFPAYHFRMSAHDLALYGQLFLNRGLWQGKQIVPAEWIDLSTQPYSIIDERYGLAYGMLWDVLVPDAAEKHLSFFHTGVDVHMLGVYPKHGLVMVHRVDTEKEYRFNGDDLYQVIRMVHGARVMKR